MLGPSPSLQEEAVDVGDSPDFTAEDWRTLEFAPFWVFSALAGTYRNFDPVEFEAFSRALDQAAYARGRLSQRLVAAVRADLRELRRRYEGDDRTIAGGLCGVAEVLATVPVAEAQLVKEMLIDHLGRSFATARGPFGREATADDQNMLELVAEFLVASPTLFTGRTGAA